MMVTRYAPAPEFSVFGLDRTWHGRRELDWVCTYRRPRATDPVTHGLWLAHLGEVGGVRVGTFRGDVLAEMGPDRSSAAARLGALALADLTMPKDMTGGDVAEVAGHAAELARQHASWPMQALRVDGDEVMMPTWVFADGWTAFAEVGAEFAVLVATDVKPQDIGLARLSDVNEYGFDATAPIDESHHRDQRRDWYETLLPQPNVQWHSDHRALFRK